MKGCSNKHWKTLLVTCIIGIMINLIFANFYHSGLFLTLNDEINEEMNNEGLRTSYFNKSMNPIFINNSDSSCDWEWAKDQDWCTYENGIYYIENLTINGQNSSNCIEIRNSDVKFRIKNCTVFNSSSGAINGGIVLMNVNNSLLIDNNCSYNNRNGITLVASNNNSIIGNIANNNNGTLSAGIKALLNSIENNITGNIICNNSNYGIAFYGTVTQPNQYNNLVENTANYNDKHGIYIEGFNYNNSLLRNNASYR